VRQARRTRARIAGAARSGRYRQIRRPAALGMAIRGLFRTSRADQDLAHNLMPDSSRIVALLLLAVSLDLVGLLSEGVLAPARLNDLSDCGSPRGNDSTTNLASVHSLQPEEVRLQGRLSSLKE
jgi:hypothetical protein